MKSTLAAAAFAALLALGIPPAAQAAPGPGVRSGQLTAGELRDIKQDVHALTQARKVATRDGRVTLRERQRISSLQRELRRSTQVYMHNGHTR